MRGPAVSDATGVIKQLDQLAEFQARNPTYQPDVVRVNISEKYLRSKLHLAKDAPLRYKGLTIECSTPRVQQEDAQA